MKKIVFVLLLILFSLNLSVAVEPVEEIVNCNPLAPYSLITQGQIDSGEITLSTKKLSFLECERNKLQERIEQMEADKLKFGLGGE